MPHLAVNVYHWGSAPQHRLLADCLGPAARELQGEGLLDRFWFTRFDTRGPHVCALFTPPAGRDAELRARLGAHLDAYLGAHPSTEIVSDEEIERRHAECRGKQLCVIDDEPGFAANNTYLMAPHPPDGYPFQLGYGVAAEGELWRLVQELALWAIEQLQAGTATAGAVRWIAAVDRELLRAGANPAEFWRHHATTLLVYLEERLEADEAQVLATLPTVVGERNRAVFDRLWSGDTPGMPDAGRLVDIVLAGDGRTPLQQRRLLREVNHCALAQLGQPVLHHIPLVLYAWQRNLPPQAA